MHVHQEVVSADVDILLPGEDVREGTPLGDALLVVDLKLGLPQGRSRVYRVYTAAKKLVLQQDPDNVSALIVTSLMWKYFVENNSAGSHPVRFARLLVAATLARVDRCWPLLTPHHDQLHRMEGAKWLTNRGVV